MKQPVPPTDQFGRISALEEFLSNPTDDAWTKLRNAIHCECPLRVIVTIQGGNYQGAAAAGPIDLSILDYDNWEVCDETHEDDAEHYAELAEHYAELEAEVERLKADSTTSLL